MASSERAAKRAKLVLDEDSSDSGRSDEGAQLPTTTASNGFQVNEEYAKRFEHNKKREEKQRLEEKFAATGGAEDEGDESSSDESEDDDAELADMEVDHEIEETLRALRSKDPRIYDSNVKFYRDWEAADDAGKARMEREKPMYLQDYHRQNLMDGYAGGAENDEMAVMTHDQEQDALKKQLVGSMHASAAAGEVDANAGEADDDDDDFLVAKPKPQNTITLQATSSKRKLTDRDIATADKDPETFLSNFMAARGWLANNDSAYKPLDEDDSEDEQRADKFEEAWNLRFEDHAHANETLLSFSRDVGKYGVRRDEQSGRQKAREREKERKEAERRERDEDRARLRRLKVEEAEEKIDRIRDAAGLRGKDVDLAQWRDMLEGDFEDDEWDQEMKRRFGESYYAENEGEKHDAGSEDGADAGSKKHRAKKPKWEDDIDINDLLPDSKGDDEKAEFSLSDEEEQAEGGVPVTEQEGDDDGMALDENITSAKPKRKTKKDRERDKVEEKRAARKQRRAIEELVDSALPINHPTLATSSKKAASSAAGFRYRATSPTSYGLSSRDILFADDAALNTFVGLKKMHAFRDTDKKRKDKKRLSKKARLREWRKETFGDTDGPKGGFERFTAAGGDGEVAGLPAIDERPENVKEGESKKKRKRSGKKGKDIPAEADA